MNMEKEIKAAYFAMYWNQEVMMYNNSEDKFWSKHIYPIDERNMQVDLSLMHLLLKSLSDISDEDFTEVMFKKYPYQPWSTLKRDNMMPEHLNQEQVDYLRSKGYALPYHDLSVEKLEEYGWIKLTRV